MGTLRYTHRGRVYLHMHLYVTAKVKYLPEHNGFSVIVYLVTPIDVLAGTTETSETELASFILYPGPTSFLEDMKADIRTLVEGFARRAKAVFNTHAKQYPI